MTTGLLFPDDLAAWHRWAQRQRGLMGMAQRLKGSLSSRVREPAGSGLTLWLPPETATSVVVLDNRRPTVDAVLRRPLQVAASTTGVALICVPGDPLPTELAERSGAGAYTAVDYHGPASLPTTVERVLSVGAAHGAAAELQPWARQRDRPFIVAQHGLLTPYGPPLTDGDHLLAWSEADADYWRAGRTTITFEVVGAQLLWQAQREPEVVVRDDRPVMLGQLHGDELPRGEKLRLYRDYCRATGATYRPHPAERDVVSRVGHRWLERSGVVFETSSLPLIELARPVVSIFSTGTLEAAQRGLPAWVHHPRPPAWLRDFWQRYGLQQTSDEPTPRTPQAELQPAAATAQALGLG